LTEVVVGIVCVGAINSLVLNFVSVRTTEG